MIAFVPAGITRCALCDTFVPYINVEVLTFGEPPRPDIDYLDDDDWHEPGCPETCRDPNCVNGPDCPCFRCGGDPNFDWG